MLGTAVVCLLFVAWVARPWVRAMGSLARRRASATAWGPAAAEPPAGTEHEAVTLRGRLEADAPIPHLRGPETIAATLRGSRTSDGHLAAEGLRLRMGEQTIPIEGPVEVLVGALEEHPRSMPEKTEYRFAEAKNGPTGEEQRLPKRAQLRRIPNGAEVIVRGHLERRAADGGQYREGAHGWALVPGEDGERTVLAAAEPRRVRFPARDWLLRTLVLGLLVFVLLPLGLQHAGKRLGQTGNERLRDCRPIGHGWLEAADWVARIQGIFPGFGAAALKRRLRSVTSAVNGVRVCAMDEDAPPGWVEPLIELGRERLPALADHEAFDSARSELEATLHEAGYDDAIVELQAELPKGGDVTERVRAHLYLGDLEGAEATWDEPGAEMSERASGVLQKGTILCLAGRHGEALEAFAEHLEAMSGQEDLWLRQALFRDGLCSLRAGELERAERRLERLEAMEFAHAEKQLLRARLAAERGTLLETIEGFDEAVREPTALLVAVALAETEQWDRLLAWIERTPLDYRLTAQRIDGRVTSGIFSSIYFPALSVQHLLTLAEALEEAAPQLAAEDAPADGSIEQVLTEYTGPSRAEVARQRAGEIHRYLAVLHGRRWDPRADEELDQAERLLGSERIAPLREALAFFHGDWEQTRDAQDPEIRALSRTYLDGEPHEGLDRIAPPRELGLALLNPSDFAAEEAIAGLYLEHEWRSAVDRWERLRVQSLSASWSVLFYRDTKVVVHGERLPVDEYEVGDWHDYGDLRSYQSRLEALRTLVNAQPDPHLLMGADSRAEL